MYLNYLCQINAEFPGKGIERSMALLLKLGWRNTELAFSYPAHSVTLPQ